MKIPKYPKILAIGEKYIQSIFDEEVEVTEKLDGSQFKFVKFENELIVSSKNKQLILDAPEKMFRKGIEYLESIKDKITPDVIYYAEYLQKPKHNTLAYDHIPQNHFALFGIKGIESGWVDNYSALKVEADSLGIDTVPLLYQGMINSPTELLSMLEKTSYLGGQKIEGIVIKNYKDYWIADRLQTVMAGKYVSEQFKEVHNKNWKENTGRSKWELFIEKFRSEARWNKAVVHMKEDNTLIGSPRDIGGLIKRVKADIIEEEKENIKGWLWKEFSEQLLRKATAGLPEWYKEQLLKGEYDDV